MDIKNLSSNWRKLQQDLKSSETQDRKVAHQRTISGVKFTTQSNEPYAKSSAKKRKLNDQDHRSSRIPSESTVRFQNRKGLLTGGRKPNTEQTKMGLLPSRPAGPDAPEDHEAANKAKMDNGKEVILPNAIEDIPESQRLLVPRGSEAMQRHKADMINSGLVTGVRAGKYVSLDCEMVGVGPVSSGRSMLARASLVNFMGEQLYDSFVAPKEPVTDYRTIVSGITPDLLKGARSFEVVQQEVADLLQGRVLIGHAVRNDLDTLMLGHPKRDIRDTSKYKPYREISGGRTPALKRLAKELLGLEIQGGAHSSVEDARTTMMLYRREKEAFEREHVRKYGVDRRQHVPQLIEGETSPAKIQAYSKRKGKSKKTKRKR